MKILERMRLEALIKNMPVGGTDPKTEKELKEIRKQLNLILNRWKWGEEKTTTAEQFINKFAPWINKQLEAQKELEEFLNKYSVNTLEELRDYIANLPTGETTNEELTNFLKDNRCKDLYELQGLILDLERKITELKESKAIPEDQALEIKDLTIERDEAIRDKKTAEQEVLSLNNRLNLKNEEVKSKNQAVEQLKKEKSQSEIALNKKITQLRKEQEELKKKYSKQGKLLDEEQTDNNKLTNKIEELEAKIKELTKE